MNFPVVSGGYALLAGAAVAGPVLSGIMPMVAAGALGVLGDK